LRAIWREEHQRLIAEAEAKKGRKLTWREKQHIGPAGPGQTTQDYADSFRPVWSGGTAGEHEYGAY